ncbi:MAG: 50S ribosomal protein L21 [Candidatus Pacebacteria bacterium]|nr:50S ribosomal protein L21 [Candidatus Paceibacterota bacterium]
MPTTEKTKTTAKKVNKDTFAVIATGGKQYTVAIGDSIKIEKIEGDHKEGEKVSFDNVLLVDDGKDTTIGDPYVKGAKVEGKILEIGRSRKVDVVKYKAKSRYFKRNGHRQPFYKIEIVGIK